MQPTPGGVLPWLAAACALLLGPRLAAQNVLYVDHGGKSELVRAADGIRPRINEGGKLVTVNGTHFVLAAVPEYLPAFVAIRNFQLTNWRVDMHGQDINQRMRLRADFASPDRLEDLFIVIELTSANLSHGLFLYGVGRLEPREPREVNIAIPFLADLGKSKFVVHVFAGGREVLNSRMPVAYREAILDRMVAQRIAATSDAPPRRFLGPDPAYPAQLWQAKARGRAVISVAINRRGGVDQAAVETASEPAFGAAALEAVRQWRFLPEVRDSRPVAARVNIPIDFAPPAHGPA